MQETYKEKIEKIIKEETARRKRISEKHPYDKQIRQGFRRNLKYALIKGYKNEREMESEKRVKLLSVYFIKVERKRENDQWNYYCYFEN